MTVEYKNIEDIVLLLLCMLVGFYTNAQQDRSVELLSTNDGLSQGLISDILQDREGFLWLGTKDGLNRYDGYEFKVFTNDPNDPWSISGNTVNHLFEDSAGRIWATSANAGINIYDKKTGRFHHIRHDPQNPASLSGNYISSIVEDSSGYFVVVVAEQEINMFLLEDDFFELQKMPPIIRVPIPAPKQEETNPYTIVKGIVKDSKDRIWVGGKDVIYQLHVQQAKLELAIEGYSLGTVSTNSDGSLWSCGANHPLFHWDGSNANRFLKNFTGANDILVDEQGDMWLLRSDSLFGINTEGWQKYSDKDRGFNRFFYRWKPSDFAGDYSLKSMEKDRAGLIWVGTNGHGLYKINPKHKRFSHHLPSISVRQIAAISDNDLRLLSYDNKWYKGDGTFLEMDPLGIHGSKYLNDFMLVSRSGDYWIRQPFISDGVFKIKKYNPQTEENRFYDISWHHYGFQPIIECQDGAIWMAGFNETLTHIEPITGAVLSYNFEDGKRRDSNEEEKILSYRYSTALYEDGEGILWAGTERGFSKCIRPSQVQEALKITNYKNIPDDVTSLSYNHVTCFLDDPVQPNRYLWVCTKGGGINRMDKASGSFLRFTKEDGLPDNVVYGILADQDGNIWGSTNNGIFCMSPNKEITNEGSPRYLFRNFSKADGLQENEFNTGAFTKLPDGRLAFGGINGYNTFYPKEILSDDYSPPIFITNILVNNQLVLPGDQTNILETTIETTKEIVLTHLQDILTLEFASLDFSAPNQNKYRYQLVGTHDTWVEAGSRRSATFLHLQPKDYIFRVQGSNSQGIWSDQFTELRIRVLPPWWKTWWAFLFYAGVIGAVIWTYIWFSIKRVKLQEQLAFEKREAERVRDLDAMKTQLYMNMTHEFRTPLTIILGMAKQVQENPEAPFHSGLNMIIRNGQNLLSLVNKMLDLSKLESGKMTLELIQGDIVFFLRNMVASFRSYAANKEIQLHFLSEVDEVLMDFDADKLQQVVSNLISNAFKFTPENGHIYFGIRKENDTIIIRVKDTGRGIPESDLHKIFGRFYQVDNSMTRQYEGTGIGLALCKDLIKLMQGEIAVQSPPVGAKNGSEFIIVLPIRQEASLEKIENSRQVPPNKKSVKEAVLNRDTPLNKSVNNAASQLFEKKKKQTEPSKKPLILLVEDNSDVVAYIATCLTDYRLAVAENGQEGFEIATELIPDLVISDVMMPVMDGFEFCRKLKSDQRTNHIPVIMLTARADMDSKLEGLELGANTYLSKPFKKEELLLTIKNLFGLRDKLRQYYQNMTGLTVPKEQTVDHSQTPKPEDAFVIKSRTFIEAHISDVNFNVEQLSKALHLSHSQFARKLDALTGYSPNQFIRFIRLKKAKELLQNPDLSVTAIAYDCGFNDPSYFTRVFKKEFGKTPGEWRNQPPVSSDV